MAEKNFTHLHVHTEYSLLDGAARINDLLDAAKNFGMNSIAITDHGTMYGVVNFYKAAVKRGIKPIIGCEVYVAPRSRFDKEKIDAHPYHLILLAENNDGYKNLVKLASHAATEGFYYRPRVDKELLKKYHGGLIALSACVAGEIPRAIRHEDFSRAKELIAEYVEIFGRNNFFLEIQNHGLEDEFNVRDALKKFSAEFNLPLVATNDLHYVRREDAEFHDLLLCLQTGKKINDEHRLKFSSDDYFLKSADEMRELFDDVPEACDNTLRIAERCNVTLEFGKFQMPQFPLPEGYIDAAEYLRDLCREKLPTRYDVVTDEVTARLERELEIIHGMGYDGYFLIVWDFINFARRKKISVGPGRGSAAGSLVAYLLGITELDPLKYGLLFERFLNPERVTLPDIDVDLCYIRRDEVISYVRERYGADKVSQIVTFGTMATKAAIRDVTRVLEYAYSVSSQIVKLVPNVLNITIDDALKTSNELRTAYETDGDTHRIIDFARKLEGLPRHTSVHAAGIVISKRPLDEIVPLQISNGILVTQYDKDAVEELGLLKMDFLGLRTLTIMAETFDNIKATRGIELEPSKIPLRDEKTSAMLTAGDTAAVFQMESAGMTALVKDLRPKCFEDLIPTVALYRPGPLGSGMVENFITVRNEELGVRSYDNSKLTLNSKPNYLHPKLEPILRETFGVILYQEQVMQIVQTLAGFTLGQADILRRAMGKKKADILLAQKENFLRGCAANGVSNSLAEKIFDLLTHFADYGFNKSHSAAYGLLAWQTAYLKAHYPAEYMAAMMSGTPDPEKVAAYIEISRRMGIKILPPDVNASSVHFTVDGGAIRFGLRGIKSVGDAAYNNIINERKRGGKFKSPTDFCGRVDPKNVSRRVLENLIKCGAFDTLDKRRSALLAAIGQMSFVGTQRQQERLGGAINLFGDDELHKTNITIPDAKEVPFGEILAWERETLGFYLSGHPLEIFREQIGSLTSSKELGGKISKRVKVGGIVTSLRQLLTRRGEPMAFLTVEDFDGAIDVTIFPNVFSKIKDDLLPNDVAVVAGRVETSNDSLQIIADNVTRAEKYAPDFWLTIPAQLDTPATTDALRKIFDAYTGESLVYLNRGGKWLKLPQKIADGMILRGELKNLLGAENVRLY